MGLPGRRRVGGACNLIAKAIEAELAEVVKALRAEKTPEGHNAAVRNGYLPGRFDPTGSIIAAPEANA